MAPDGTSRRARRGREPIERAHVQPEGSAAERGRSPAWLTWIAAAGALVFLSWPQRRLFGDGVLLEGMIGSSPAPYYHVAYVPLGWLVFHGLSPLFRWTALDALEALSGLAGGLALALLARLLARRGLTGWGGRCALALVAASPGMLFFATLGEVHTVQMLGAVLGMSLADAARAAPARRAGWLAAAAVVAPVMFHLSGVALAPCLLALAWGRAPGRGISWRALPGLVLAIALACGVLAVGAWTLARALDPLRALSNPGRLLWVFASELAARLAGRGPFSPAEVWDYLRAEFWTPAGLLLPLALAAFARSRAARELLWPLLLALAPYVLVVPQGGVREAGGYYLSLLPLLALWLAAAGEPQATAPRGAWRGPLALVLVAVQLGLAWRHRAAWRERLEARVFAGRLASAIPGAALLYTDDLARVLAVSQMRPDVETIDALRVLELNPTRAWPGVMPQLLASGAASLEAGRAVYVDAELMREPARSAQAAAFAQAIRAAGVGLEPVPVDDPVAYLLAAR
jgi:hypothetical protein